MQWLARIPYALVVAGVTALVVGGVVGFAVAASDDTAIPLVFGVAPPHIGDQWEYDLHMETWAEGDPVLADFDEVHDGKLRYTWVEQRAWQDMQGLYHPAAMLYEDARFDDEAYDDIAGGWVGFVVPFDQDRAIAAFSNGTDPFSAQISSSLPFGLGGPTTTRGTTDYFETRFRGAIDPFCGYRSNLQGGEVELAQGVRFVGQCEPTDLLDELGYLAAAVFMPHSVEQRDGMQTVLFRETFRLQGLDARLDLWMARHVPYPVAMAMSIRIDVVEAAPELAAFVTPGTVLRAEAELTMSGFQRGTEPIRVDAPLPPPNVLPAIQLGDRQIHGPSDVGIDHPYPLSQAFQEARTATSFQDLRSFLVSHPDAAVTHAEHWELETDDGMEQHWRFQVDDGRDWITIHARKDPVEAVVEPPITPPEQTGMARPRFASEATVLGHLIDPDDRPDRLPTATSVLDRWSAMNPGITANTYQLAMTCRDCLDEATVFAGRRDVTADEPSATAPVTGETITVTSELHVLGVNDEGEVVVERTETSQQTTYTQGLVELGDEPPAKTAPERPEPVPVATAGVWQMPLDAAAAGVGLAALLAGVLYYLWPLVKAGPMALFSRVQGPGLLEHPVRAQLMDVVQERPGVHYQQIVRDLGKGRGVIEHHIRKLEQSGFIVAHKTDGMTCYFPKGAVDRHIMSALPVVKAATAQTILRAIIARPRTTQRDIAQTLGLSPSTINHHVRRLAAAGVIEKVAAGPEQQLFPTQVAAKALALAAA